MRTGEEPFTPLPLPVLLTSKEVARALKVSPSTLCRWRQSGLGPRVTWLTPSVRDTAERTLMDG